MASCPNKNLQEWKDLVDKVGENKAYFMWDKKYSKVFSKSDNSDEDFINSMIRKVDNRSSDVYKRIQSIIDRYRNTDESVNVDKLAKDFNKSSYIIDKYLPNLQLFNSLYNHLKKNKFGIKINFSDLTPADKLGSYSPDTKEVLLYHRNITHNISKVLKNNPNQVKKEEEITLASTALIISHEVTHALLPEGLSISTVEINEVFGGDYNEWEKAVLKFNSEITKEELKFIKDVNKLYDYAKSKSLNKDKYGFTNAGEFMSELIGSYDFQKELASIKYGNSNVLSKIMNIISNWFASIGINIKDTVLEEGLRLFTDYTKIKPNSPIQQSPEQSILNDIFGNKDFNQLTASDTKPIKELDDKLKEWFTLAGINYQNVDKISNEMGLDPIARADVLRGLLEVVEGRADATTLSEEAGHFLVEMMSENNPLLTAMMSKVESTKMYQQVLAEYGEVYQGNIDKLKKEAIGKLIAQEVVKLYEATQESEVTKTAIQRFFDNITRWFKSKFRFLTSNEVFRESESFREAAKLLLDTDKLNEELESGGLKKIYSEKTWNGNKSDYYYQSSNEAVNNAKIILENIKTKIATNIDGVYQTETGESLFYRVTSHVNEFYNKIFRTGNKTDNESDIRKNKGTFIHKILQLIVNDVVNGVTLNEASILTRSRNELLNIPEFKQFYREYGENAFSLGVGGFTDLKNLAVNTINQINENSKTVSEISGVEGEPTILSEVSVYDKGTNTAGTIDLLVVYPNGTVGIYDFKSMNFTGSTEVKPVKMRAFEIQLDWYKRILVNNYGVKDFAESRIIPIDVKVARDARVFSLKSGGVDHLAPIPIKEYTSSPEFNKQLTKLYDYATLLRTKIQKDYSNVQLKTRLNRIEKTIKGLLVSKDLTFLASELNDLREELLVRSKIDSSSENSKHITDNDLNEMIEFINVVKDVTTGYKKYVGRESIEKNKKLYESILIIQDRIADITLDLEIKARELSNKILPDTDIDTAHKQLGFFARLFNPVFYSESPALKKIKHLIENMSFSVWNDVNAVVKDVEVKRDTLEKWAISNGMSLMDAYELLINENTGNLVGTVDKKYFEDKELMLKASPEKRGEWFNKYHQFDKEAYSTYIKKRIDEINKEYPGKYKENLRKSLIENLEKKFNINAHAEAFNENNRFLKLKIENFPSEYLNPKWRKINQTPELKDFYDTFVKYNRMFSEMTGRDIDKLFVPEIRKDLLSRGLHNGLGSMFKMGQIFRESLEVTLEDEVYGAKDPATGESVESIPLLYSHKLTSNLTASEIANLEAEATAKFPNKQSQEYIEFLRGRVYSEMRKKGLATKSYDLASNLVIFAKASYSYKYLSETEAYVKNLKWYYDTKGGKTVNTDASGNPVFDKFTKTLSTKIGIPKDEQDLLDNIINGVWYGKKTLDKDTIFGEKEVTDSQGRVIANSVGFSRNKLVKNLIQYVSIKSLGLNPFVAVGNVIGITGNLYMTATEGNIINRTNLKQAQTNGFKDREKYLAAIEILNPYAHDNVREIANSISATKLEKLLTVDNAFVLMKKPDEWVDGLITNSMLLSYGVHNGVIKHLSKLPKESKALYEYLVKDEKGDWKFEGVSLGELSRFRTGIFKIANKVKGSVPEHMKAAYSRTMAGQILMHFRSWMPGLISNRFKDISYDEDLDTLDAGRFRVFWGELVNSGGFAKGLKEFITILGEATVTGYFNGGLKKINMRATSIAFEKFKASNPDTNLTINDFIEMRKAKIKGMAAELRVYFLMMMLVALAKSAIPDDDEDKLGKFISRNAYLMANKGFLELSFFLQPSSITEVVKQPIPSLSLLTDSQKMIQNFFGESSRLITGEVNNRDKSPFGYYTLTKFVPGGKVSSDVFDLFNNFKTY
jgi:hypothetical protein